MSPIKFYKNRINLRNLTTNLANWKCLRPNDLTFDKNEISINSLTQWKEEKSK
jgi:hypothetical protein